MNMDVTNFTPLNELFEEYPEYRILAAALFIDKIPLFVIHKLEVRHLEMFAEDYKFVYLKQVYKLNHLDEKMKHFLNDLLYECPSDPIFTRFSKRITVAHLKEFSQYVQCNL